MPSFDAVCSADMAEVEKAVTNARRNFGLRLDCKDTSAAVDMAGARITLTGDTEAQLADLEDVLLHKLMKRRVDARFLIHGDTAATPEGTVQRHYGVRDHLAPEDAERMRTALLAAAPTLAITIAPDWVHIAADDKDTLRTAMHVLREQLSDLPISFANLHA